MPLITVSQHSCHIYVPYITTIEDLKLSCIDIYTFFGINAIMGLKICFLVLDQMSILCAISPQQVGHSTVNGNWEWGEWENRAGPLILNSVTQLAPLKEGHLTVSTERGKYMFKAVHCK